MAPKGSLSLKRTAGKLVPSTVYCLNVHELSTASINKQRKAKKKTNFHWHSSAPDPHFRPACFLFPLRLGKMMTSKQEATGV